MTLKELNILESKLRLTGKTEYNIVDSITGKWEELLNGEKICTVQVYNLEWKIVDIIELPMGPFNLECTWPDGRVNRILFTPITEKYDGYLMTLQCINTLRKELTK